MRDFHKKARVVIRDGDGHGLADPGDSEQLDGVIGPFLIVYLVLSELGQFDFHFFLNVFFWVQSPNYILKKIDYARADGPQRQRGPRNPANVSKSGHASAKNAAQHGQLVQQANHNHKLRVQHHLI